ncbi:MAG: dTDP-4-dehydrorhamnose 3,5-epimerase family protein [Bdellovibrionota bacterium]
MGQLVPLLDGVNLVPLKIIKDDRGMVMHMIRSDQPNFKKFGEIYFSVTNPGVTKGWKRHRIMEQNFAVPQGEMEFTLFDDRPASATQGKYQRVQLGLNNYQLLQVPPMIWYCFSTKGSESAMIANCATIPHDPSESETAPLEKFLVNPT